MGSPKSTRWKGAAVHGVTENFARLCIHDLCGKAGRIEDLGLDYLILRGNLTLLWLVEGSLVFQEIILTWTPCPHTGGQTTYFRCPGCGRRVAILYAREGTCFRCRHCWDLHYACQQERPRKRAERRLKKLFEKMGQPWPEHLAFPPDKKPGMHTKTFQRLKNRYMITVLEHLSLKK